MNMTGIILSLVLAPLYIGIINQTKAFFAGRRGSGFLRPYWTIAKLLGKSHPKSATTNWIFAAAPSVTVASTVAAALVFPFAGNGNSFFGGLSAVLFFYLLAAGRFFTVLAAYDTGSAFEDMGGAREATFSGLIEGAIFAILGFLSLASGETDIASVLGDFGSGDWLHHSISIVMALAAMFAILLAETCRVPFDDPETHLELTMIHEAMILDNSGPDLAFIHYGAALKFELLAGFLAAMALPSMGGIHPLARLALFFGAIAAIALLTGIIESTMAKMRFTKTPQTIFAIFIASTLAAVLFIL